MAGDAREAPVSGLHPVPVRANKHQLRSAQLRPNMLLEDMTSENKKTQMTEIKQTVNCEIYIRNHQQKHGVGKRR